MPLLETPIAGQTATAGFDIGLGHTEGIEKHGGMLRIPEGFFVAMYLGQSTNIGGFNVTGVDFLLDQRRYKFREGDGGVGKLGDRRVIGKLCCLACQHDRARWLNSNDG